MPERSYGEGLGAKDFDGSRANRKRVIASLIAAVLLVPTAVVAAPIETDGESPPETPEPPVSLHLSSIDTDPGSDQIGMIDPASGAWHLRELGGAVTTFFYGNPGDEPFVGDWDCDGVDTPGLYRRSDGYAYLRNSNSQGVADIAFFFGNPGDVPIAGDFNGDGCDTLSIYRPSESRIYVINSLGSNDTGLGAAEYSYLFGNPGDKPFIGDFDGDGIDTIGLHRETTGLVYFRNSNADGVADAQFIFGDPGDRLVAGDWGVVDGIDTPALFRPGNATHYLRFTNSQGPADETLSFGQSGFVPVAGRWSLDKPASDTDAVDSGDGTGGSAGPASTTNGPPDYSGEITGVLVAADPPSNEFHSEEFDVDSLLAAAEALIGTSVDLEFPEDPDFTAQMYAGEPIFASLSQNASYGFRANYRSTAIPQVGRIIMWTVANNTWTPVSSCSGTVVSRDLVITAAHCIWPPATNNPAGPLGTAFGGWTFHPGVNSNAAGLPNSPYGSWGTTASQWSTHVFVPSGWAYNQNSTYRARTVFDYALLKLNPVNGTLPGDFIQPFGVAWNTEQLNLAKYSLGYPVDGVFAGTPNRQWYCSSSHGVLGSLVFGQDFAWERSANDGWYSMGIGCNANGGMSGGPILAYVSSLGGWHVVSVNSTMTYGSRGTYLRNLWGPEFRSHAGVYGFDALWNLAR